MHKKKIMENLVKLDGNSMTAEAKKMTDQMNADFRDYHIPGKPRTGEPAISMINKITDTISTMKSKFKKTNFSFSQEDVLKLELVNDLLNGKDYDKVIYNFKEKKENLIREKEMDTNPFIQKLINKQPFTKDELIVKTNLDLRSVKFDYLPEGLEVRGHLNLSGTNITSLPIGLEVGDTLSLFGCKELTKLPEGLHVEGDLNLEESNVSELPENLRVYGGIYVENSPLDKYPAYKLKAMVKSGGIGQIFF